MCVTVRVCWSSHLTPFWLLLFIEIFFSSKITPLDRVCRNMWKRTYSNCFTILERTLFAHLLCSFFFFCLNLVRRKNMKSCVWKSVQVYDWVDVGNDWATRPARAFSLREFLQKKPTPNLNPWHHFTSWQCLLCVVLVVISSVMNNICFHELGVNLKELLQTACTAVSSVESHLRSWRKPFRRPGTRCMNQFRCWSKNNNTLGGCRDANRRVLLTGCSFGGIL